ncbi:hypothetical protein SAMN06265222_102370 [Neorhodopirellula lusitana]|uniref:Uncharacterized protein n=1 Tax=Neorhodopirellula lusitana TaxID=445327 RepID=A0ABY1PV51_9BACT|nr:hypothetical protein SAMN06265222_102370 [Neorhodopirellula lusitana]
MLGDSFSEAAWIESVARRHDFELTMLEARPLDSKRMTSRYYSRPGRSERTTMLPLPGSIVALKSAFKTVFEAVCR